ncbi:MAG: ABC transporter permease, partial [Tannerellaceae bacterium]|nr:ABC transporter permease [Tannerellaceae bacterium]
MKIIRLALRSILTFRSYSTVNVIGLTLSLVCVIVIFRYVHGELTVDHFNSRLERMFVTYMEDSNYPDMLAFGGIFNPNMENGFADLSGHPGVERHSLFFRMADRELVYGERTYNGAVLVVDSNFMQITDYPVVEGTGDLVQPEDALIAKAFAEKLFGEESPIGKTIRYASLNKEVRFTGVIGRPETKSMLNFDIVLSSQLYPVPSVMPQKLLLLYPGVNYQDINVQYNAFINMGDRGNRRFQLYPYKKVYFESDIMDYSGYAHGRYVYVTAMFIVGLLILLIGVVNFISIYTVVVLHRGREFGMKKVFGAKGSLIFIQLFAENFVLIALSLLLALGVAEALNPVVQNVLGFDQFPYTSFDGRFMLGLLFVLPLVTSLFPYYHYTYSTPVRSLQQVSKGGKAGLSRRAFLLFQYVITFTMIILSLFFVKQLNYMLHAHIGYRTEGIIKVPFLRQKEYNKFTDEEREKEKQFQDEIKQKLDASPLITDWIIGNSPNSRHSSFEFRKPGGEFKKVTMLGADEKWLNLFDIQLVEGRLLEDDKDDFYGYNLIVSESALKLFEIDDYREAELEPFQRLWWATGSEEERNSNPPYRIVGVVKDYYTSHLSQPQHPVVIYYSPSWLYDPVIAAYTPGREKEVVAFMKQTYDEIVGGEFSYSFLADEVAAVYREDKRVATIYSLFSLIAIIVSSLGLFSLSLFDVRRQRKNITIRKINGATTKEIMSLLLKKYIFLLGISFVVAAPLSWLAITRYLEGFAFKAPVSWWLFAVALIITAAVSLLTLVWQIRQAASANPAEA